MLARKQKEDKDHRIDLRISAEQKRTFEHAARAKGLSLSAYIISTVVTDAFETIERRNRISLTNKTARIFLEAIEAEPNKRLIEAAKKFRNQNH